MKERKHDKQQYYLLGTICKQQNLIYKEKMKSLVRGKKDLHREKLIK
jgi:hypothetical protein